MDIICHFYFIFLQYIKTDLTSFVCCTHKVINIEMLFSWALNTVKLKLLRAVVKITQKAEINYHAVSVAEHKKLFYIIVFQPGYPGHPAIRKKSKRHQISTTYIVRNENSSLKRMMHQSLDKQNWNLYNLTWTGQN